MKSRYIFGFIMVAAVFMTAAATASAQPEHNDSLRTRTWSFYLEGGVSSFHGMHNGYENQYDRDEGYLAPAADFGFFFYPRPWVRFGLDFGYSYLKSKDLGPTLLNYTTVEENAKRGAYTGTLKTEAVRAQNDNFTHLGSADLTLGIDFIEIWRERESQWFNIWLSAGAGYMHGWNSYLQTWGIKETLLDKGTGHMTLWMNEEVKSETRDNQFNTLYIPFGLSLEFDVIPQLTLGAFGKYKYFPLMQPFTPTGIWTAGLAVRYNIVGRKQGFQNNKDIINSLKSDVAFMEQELKTAESKNANLVSSNAKLTEENSGLKTTVVALARESNDKTEALAAAQAAVDAANAKLREVETPLSNFAVQIMAFRRFQHAPDDAIFFGDNPTIYLNGDLRRYVVFTDTLEGAKQKLVELKKKYSDAFIVTIDDDGTVKPYRK